MQEQFTSDKLESQLKRTLAALDLGHELIDIFRFERPEQRFLAPSRGLQLRQDRI